MLTHLRPAVVLFAAFTLLTGVVYPLLVTGVARVFFPSQAGGSLIVQDDEVRGSALIGQWFDHPGYFWPRPSATEPAPYTAFDPGSGAGGTGSNYGPLNPALTARIAADLQRLQAAERAAPPGQTSAAASAMGVNGVNAQPAGRARAPVDLLTASASGLDPHISPAAAEYQAERVARVRGLPVETVRELIARHTEPRQLGLLGQPRVHVLRLNLALDALKPEAAPR